jgi:hypothetical protein
MLADARVLSSLLEVIIFETHTERNYAIEKIESNRRS